MPGAEHDVARLRGGARCRPGWRAPGAGATDRPRRPDRPALSTRSPGPARARGLRTASRTSSSAARARRRLGAHRQPPSPARATTSRSSASWARRSHSSTRGHDSLTRPGSEIAAAKRRLELGLDHRDRSAELVARVGDEAALALEGRRRRSSISLSVSPRRRSSSRRTATAAARRRGSRETSAARRRIASTGARPAAASAYRRSDASTHRDRASEREGREQAR